MNGTSIDRSRLFFYFMAGLFLIMLLFGAGTFFYLIFESNGGIALRLLAVFASMFTGVLGFGSGYLLGGAAQAAEHAEQRKNGDR